MNKKQAANSSIEQLLHTLQSSHSGLTSSEACNRLKTSGPNLLRNEAGKNALSLLLHQFHSSLVYLLVIASLLSFALNDRNDGIVIAVILLINCGLGFYQEFRSERAVERLQKLVGKDILVLRDDRQVLVSERLLVPGDVVILREGDVVPADIHLMSATDLAVNESQLTGESAPVGKNISGVNSLVFAGSTVEQGEAKGVVYATAKNTELGTIAHLSSSTKRVTQFERSLSSFSSFLVKVTFLTLLTVFILKLLIIHDVSHIGSLLLFIIALSIAVVPEAMPVIVTVTLSRGALNLAKRHVIAKTLSAVEDLGNITVLCSDKTGTLTENRQTVKRLTSDDPQLFQQLAIASLETLDEKRQKFQSSFDKAFLGYVPLDIQEEAKRYRRMEELPFDPTARRRRIVYSDGKKTYLVEVGSAETLLELCKDRRQDKYLRTIKEDGQAGLRHLAIAYKTIVYTDKFDILKHEDGLHFVGFVALEDPLRASAKRTIELAEKLGVRIKILSGDSREVTQYVASEVGLLSKESTVCTGDDIDRLSDSQLVEVAESCSAFARLNPEQKFRIIRLLKLHGNVVGYQGDGINDAPSLKIADVAIAVNNATDVAQESADILLLRSDIEVVINGIRFGREIFANINKYIRFSLVSNWGNFFALSVLYLISMASLPILPVQVLLTSLLTDLPCITIATDSVDTKDLMQPSRFNVHTLMLASMFLGSLTAVFEIMYYAIIKNYSPAIAETGLYLFLTFTALVVIFAIRNKDHFWRAPRMSGPMKISFAAISVLSVALVYIPATKKLLSFTALSWKLLVMTVFMSFAYFLVIDTVKVWFYKSSVSRTAQ
ncbi:MAG TPA: cation-transporting P-type ATPase [Candidatus Saccharimonadales bacterium]|nr:cation-transporting P-type ATPase [Candidatus Saccharimonadales bacterium]